MTARKCKVCGVHSAMPHGWCTWCAKSFRVRMARDGYEVFDLVTAAAWGAKRRADAMRKAGGK